MFYIAWDTDPDNPNPHELAIYDGPFASFQIAEQEAEKMAADEDANVYGWRWAIVTTPDLAATSDDKRALDELNLLLSAPEWPGASGMEDVCQIVRRTGRTEIEDAPPWERH